MITPWNAPLQTVMWKMAPALAAGCTMVIKPAEQTPVTAFELAKLAEEAGVPKGVINVVPGLGATAGAHLVGHKNVNKISFTGEHRTAMEIMKGASVNLKRLSFETGGKSPHIIFDDADLEQAINAATHSAFALCGQSCALGSRLLVHESVYDKVVNEIASRSTRTSGSATRWTRRPRWARRPMTSSCRRRCAISISAATKAPAWSSAASGSARWATAIS
jgi:acyl-CoA reductase-like NAD-dependent aldehyde dehydrogenase